MMCEEGEGERVQRIAPLLSARAAALVAAAVAIGAVPAACEQVFFCALSEQMSSGGSIARRPTALRAVHQD